MVSFYLLYLSLPFTSCSGYICISLPQSRLEALDIPMMVAHNEETNKTAYTVTVDYNKGLILGSLVQVAVDCMLKV